MLSWQLSSSGIRWRRRTGSEPRSRSHTCHLRCLLCLGLRYLTGGSHRGKSRHRHHYSTTGAILNTALGRTAGRATGGSIHAVSAATHVLHLRTARLIHPAHRHGRHREPERTMRTRIAVHMCRQVRLQLTTRTHTLYRSGGSGRSSSHTRRGQEPSSS